MSRTHKLAPALLSSLFGVFGLFGCDRAEVWDTYLDTPPVLGLRGSVALVDAEASRVVLAPVAADLTLVPQSFDIGHGYAASRATKPGDRLLVLSRGDVPRRSAEDQGPRLTVLDGSPRPSLLATYALTDPLSGLDVDPEGRFGVVFPSADDASFVLNPNELVLVDLARGPAVDNPFPMTLRSFGGRPQAFTFTHTLDLPTAEKRLLVVQTDRDVALVDLSDLSVPEVTVKLTGGTAALSPGGVAVTAGAPDRTDDARIAVRIQGDPNVVIIDLLPVPEAEQASTPQSFRVVPNIVYVGGVPSDLAFVQTDGGLRLAATVPSKHSLSLVDPTTGIATEIALGAPFERISRVTDIIGPSGEDSDNALLWSTQSASVAFVALGSTVGKPYKSVERLELSTPVASVVDVPAPNEHLKLLTSPDGRAFVVLNLLDRTASPLSSSTYGTTITPTADGERAFLLAPSASQLASLDLTSLHPRNVQLALPIDGAFDVERQDGGRALVAIHALGAIGATVLDGRSPSLANAREHAGLLLGELQ